MYSLLYRRLFQRFFQLFQNGFPVLGLRHGYDTTARSQGARSRGQQRDPEEGKNRVACG